MNSASQYLADIIHSGGGWHGLQQDGAQYSIAKKYILFFKCETKKQPQGNSTKLKMS